MDVIHRLMKKPCTPTMAAKLRAHKQLKDITDSEIRWSSTYAMIKRFCDLKKILSSMDCRDLEELMPAAKKCHSIEQLRDKLRDLDQVTKEFQSSSATLALTRALFDTVAEDFPSVESRLSSQAGIFIMPSFESGVVKILEERASDMNSEEKLEVKRLVVSSFVDTTDDGHPLSIVERA